MSSSFGPLSGGRDSDSSDELHWVRKRDGAVVAFDISKLASSLLAAQQHADPANAALVASELSQAVTHFLHLEYANQIPSTDDVSESVAKILRELGQNATAEVYARYREQRRHLRQDTQILEEPGPLLWSDQAHTLALRSPLPESVDIPTDKGDRWDKNRLARLLFAEGDLPSPVAKDVASVVEAKILGLGYSELSIALVHDLVDAELHARGLQRARRRRRQFPLPLGHLVQQLQRHTDPTAWSLAIGRDIIEQFSLQEVFSADLVALHRDGLLTLDDVAQPAHWAGLMIDSLGIAARQGHLDAFLARWTADAIDAARRSSRLIALGMTDVALTLAHDRHVEPATDRMIAGLREVLQTPIPWVVMSLFGRIPPAAARAMSQGPLFQLEPTQEQHQRTHDIALALAAAIAEIPACRDRVVLDYHVPLSEPDAQLVEQLRPWSEWAAKGIALQFSFDHEGITAAPGLEWSDQGVTGISQFVGVHLDTLLATMAGRVHEESFGAQLDVLVAAAARAIGQKREFLRRVHPRMLTGRPRERATGILVPTELVNVTEQLAGRPFDEDESTRHLAHRLLARMANRLRRENRSLPFSLAVDSLSESPGADNTLGLGIDRLGTRSPVPPRRQLDWLAELHVRAAGSQAVCLGPESGRLSADQIVQLTLYAARHTRVKRLRFEPGRP